MKLNELLKDTNYQIIGPNTNPIIKSLQFDSRKVEKGALFVAIRGVETDGHLFINKAIENGAGVVLCEQIEVIQENVLYIRVTDTATVLGNLANKFYANWAIQ